MGKTPHQLADERLQIADNYAKLGERKVELLYLHADYFKNNRPEHKSDASLERSWELTPEGLELMVIKEKMKSNEHRLSAIRTMIDVCSQEARNQF